MYTYSSIPDPIIPQPTSTKIGPTYTYSSIPDPTGISPNQPARKSVRKRPNAVAPIFLWIFGFPLPPKLCGPRYSLPRNGRISQTLVIKEKGGAVVKRPIRRVLKRPCKETIYDKKKVKSVFPAVHSDGPKRTKMVCRLRPNSCDIPGNIFCPVAGRVAPVAQTRGTIQNMPTFLKIVFFFSFFSSIFFSSIYKKTLPIRGALPAGSCGHA